MKDSRFLVRFRYLCNHCFQYENHDVVVSSIHSALRCLSIGLQKLSFDSAWIIDVSNARILCKVENFMPVKGGINNETQKS